MNDGESKQTIKLYLLAVYFKTLPAIRELAENNSKLVNTKL